MPNKHARTHARTHAHTHARTHTHTLTHTQAHECTRSHNVFHIHCESDVRVRARVCMRSFAHLIVSASMRVCLRGCMRDTPRALLVCSGVLHSFARVVSLMDLIAILSISQSAVDDSSLSREIAKSFP